MKKLLLRRLNAGIEALEARQMLSATYYVSPAGSDTNAGTSMTAPWKTVAKVNASAFLPGDSILFQYGSQFRESLNASSNGSPTAPITYGAYGDSTLTNPLFIGSDVLDTSMFTLVSGTTYSMPTSTPINWVFDNHEFMRESQDALQVAGSSQSGDPATNIGYLESNVGLFYYDASTATLYVNRGGSLNDRVITAATRQDAVFNNLHSYLTFTNLDVTETAVDNGGYGIRAQSGTNIQVLNSTASLTGKHAYGAINAPDFLGQNLTADGSAPDQGYGGASAFVAFSDTNDMGDSSQWIDDTYTNPGGAYSAFVSHGDTNSIGTILLKNIVSLGGYGTGMFIQATGGAERITVQGGELRGGQIALSADNSVIDGMKFDYGTAGVNVSGSNDIVQNCIFAHLDANIDAGENGGVDDEGTNNIARFNTFLLTGGPGLFIRNANANTQIYGNIFDCPNPICVGYVGDGQFSSNQNVFQPGSKFILGGIYATTFVTFAQWQTGLKQDANSVEADSGMIDPANDNFHLPFSSPAIDLYTGTPDATLVGVTDDFAGKPRPLGVGYDAGAYEFDATASPNPVSGSISVADIVQAAPLAGTTVPALFTVTLSAPQTVATTVHYATADGTAIAGVDYTAVSGTLSFAPGTTTATVSVLVNPALVANSSNTFQLVLTVPTYGLSLTNATATATINSANQTIVAFDKKTPATYTDAAGKKVTLKIGGVGSGSALFVTSNANPVQILLTGTTRASTFSVSTVGGTTTIQDIVIRGDIASITTTASLTGNLEITGAVSRITLGNLNSGSSILIDGAAGRPSLKVGAVTDATVNSAASIDTFTASSWAGSITAPAITALTVKGAFVGHLILSGAGIALASAKLGSITSSKWSIVGSVGTISAVGAVMDSSIRTGGNITKVTVGAAIDSTFFAGVASTLTALPTAAGDFIQSSAIGSFTLTAPKTFANAFTNSYVAAAKILIAKVQRVQTANNGTAFGFATQALGGITDVEAGKKTVVWTIKTKTPLPTFAGDFRVSVI